jgi:hypothetical protein
MTNKARPDIPIKIGGKLRHLRLDLNAMAEFEGATGQSLFGANIVQIQKMGAKGLRALIWACLLHENKELTIEEVGGWIKLDNLADIAEQINKAFEAAVPEAEGDEKENPPLAAKTKK